MMNSNGSRPYGQDVVLVDQENGEEMTDRLLVPNFISVHSGPAPSYNFDDNSASSSSTDNEVDVKPNIQHMTKVYLERSNQCTFKCEFLSANTGAAVKDEPASAASPNCQLTDRSTAETSPESHTFGGEPVDLNTLASRLQALEQARLQDRAEIESLKGQVAVLSERVVSLESHLAASCSSRPFYKVKSEAAPSGGVECVDVDDSSDACSTDDDDDDMLHEDDAADAVAGDAVASSTSWQPIGRSEAPARLPKDIDEFIEYCRQALNTRGLTYRDVMKWSVDRCPNMSIPKLSHFMHKLLDEDKSRQMMATMQRFLEDELDVEPLPPPPAAAQEAAAGDAAAAAAAAAAATTTTTTTTTTTFLGPPVPHAADTSVWQPTLPPHISQFIDRSRQAMENRGLSATDFVNWTKNYYPLRFKPKFAQLVLEKRVSSHLCHDMLPALDEFLRDVSVVGRRKRRTFGPKKRFTMDQTLVLSQSFSANPHPSRAVMEHLALVLNTTFPRVRNWFVNRRQEHKKMAQFSRPGTQFASVFHN